jgi:hypothetical protein
MEILIGIILLAFVVGLLSRSKGDGFLDTLGSGCSALIWLVVLIVVGLVLAALYAGT